MKKSPCESCGLSGSARREPTVYGVRVLCRPCRDGYRGALRRALREIKKKSPGRGPWRRPGDS